MCGPSVSSRSQGAPGTLCVMRGRWPPGTGVTPEGEQIAHGHQHTCAPGGGAGNSLQIEQCWSQRKFARPGKAKGVEKKPEAMTD